MKTEVSAAASFITRLLKTTGLLTEEQLEQFSLSLEKALGGGCLSVSTLLQRERVVFGCHWHTFVYYITEVRYLTIRI